MFLVDETLSLEAFHISWTVLITSVAIASAFFILLVYFGIKAQFGKLKTGIETLIGSRGITMETLSPEGRVRVNGEFWNAIAEKGDIEAKIEIEVTAINHFKLTVKPVPLLTK